MKKSFVLYTDQFELVNSLTDAQAGKLFKAIYKFSLGQEFKLDAVTNVAFLGIKQTLLRDIAKWENIVDRNRQNIKKRWLPKDTKDTSGISGIPNTLDSDSDSGLQASNKDIGTKTDLSRRRDIVSPTLSLQEAWDKYSAAAFKDFEITDAAFKTSARQDFLSKAKYPTEKVVRSFISNHKATPVNRSEDWKNEYPEG